LYTRGCGRVLLLPSCNEVPRQCENLCRKSLCKGKNYSDRDGKGGSGKCELKRFIEQGHLILVSLLWYRGQDQGVYIQVA
jgi:hypothetical protein